jgi:hypothetical protein
MRFLGFDGVYDVAFAGDHGMNQCLRSLSCFFTVGLALFSTDATARASHKPHAHKAHEATKKSQVKDARPHRSAASEKRRHAKHASAQRKPKPSEASPAPREAVAPLTGDPALVKEAIDLARKAKTEEATAIRNRIVDPAAQKLVEWFILRHPETTATFGRYAAFIAANPECRAPRCCAGARRRGCGSSAAMRRRFVASLAIGPQVPRASWRWRACC